MLLYFFSWILLQILPNGEMMRYTRWDIPRYIRYYPQKLNIPKDTTLRHNSFKASIPPPSPYVPEYVDFLLNFILNKKKKKIIRMRNMKLLKRLLKTVLIRKVKLKKGYPKTILIICTHVLLFNPTQRILWNPRLIL